MPGDTFVEDGRCFLPGVEDRLGRRHRPPHPAGTRQVGGGLGVVDDPRRRRREAAFESTQPAGDVEVGAGESGDRAVGEILHPGDELVFVVDLIPRIGVEGCGGLGDRGPGRSGELGGNAMLLVDDRPEVITRPRIRLGDVDVSAQIVRQIQQVPVPADGVAVDRRRSGDGAQMIGEPGEGRTGRPQACVQIGCQRRDLADRGGIGRDRFERAVGLGGDQVDLSALQGWAAGDAVIESGDHRRHGVRDRAEPPHEVDALLLGVGGHQVEYVADRLQRRRDHVALTGAFAGVDQRQITTQRIAHRRNRHPVGGVGDGCCGQRGERRAQVPRALIDGVGGEVGDRLVVAGDPDLGGQQRIRGRARVQMSVGDLVDAGARAGHRSLVAKVSQRFGSPDL